MEVRDIYLITTDSEVIEIVDGESTVYKGCSSDIPCELLYMIVYKITHNQSALVLFI